MGRHSSPLPRPTAEAMREAFRLDGSATGAARLFEVSSNTIERWLAEDPDLYAAARAGIRERVSSGRRTHGMGREPLPLPSPESMRGAFALEGTQAGAARLFEVSKETIAKWLRDPELHAAADAGAAEYVGDKHGTVRRFQRGCNCRPCEKANEYGETRKARVREKTRKRMERTRMALIAADGGANGVYCAFCFQNNGNYLGVDACPLNPTHEVVPTYFTQDPLGMPNDKDHLVPRLASVPDRLRDKANESWYAYPLDGFEMMLSQRR